MIRSLPVDPVAVLRFQVFVDEGEMAELVLGIVVNVLRHVRVENLDRSGIGHVPGSSQDPPGRGFLMILDAVNLVVLLPQIGFEDFHGRKEAQNAGIPEGDAAAARHGLCRQHIGQQPDGAWCHQASLQDGTACLLVFSHHDACPLDRVVPRLRQWRRPARPEGSQAHQRSGETAPRRLCICGNRAEALK